MKYELGDLVGLTEGQSSNKWEGIVVQEQEDFKDSMVMVYWFCENTAWYEEVEILTLLNKVYKEQ